MQALGPPGDILLIQCQRLGPLAAYPHLLALGGPWLPCRLLLLPRQAHTLSMMLAIHLLAAHCVCVQAMYGKSEDDLEIEEQRELKRLIRVRAL